MTDATASDDAEGADPDATARHLGRYAETIEALASIRAESQPAAEDIALFHELHARHQREMGNESSAPAAEERARRVRARYAGTAD